MLWRWKFGAKTGAMTTAQRLLFAKTMIEDGWQAQLAELQRGLRGTPKVP